MTLSLGVGPCRALSENFESNFCIFNGWANPPLNAIFRLALRLRLADRNCVLQVPPRLSPGGGKPAGQDEDGRKC